MLNDKELRAQMVRYGFSQERLANAIGISYQSFSYKLNGHRQFTREEIMKISEHLELTPEMRDKIFFAE